MARRNQTNLDESVNMDSMMDNMTNVVGTLLLVLIVVQLKIGMTANQIEESLANVKPEDIAAAVLYLALAHSVTGVTLPVDGGQHLAWRTADSEIAE